MLKRSDATAMLPNHTVFPGGLLDPEGDENVEWLKYFEEFGVPEQALRRLVLTSKDRPSILAPQGTGCYDRFFKRSKIWARSVQSSNENSNYAIDYNSMQRDNATFDGIT